MTDIDIDFKDRSSILNKLHHIPASIIKDNNVTRHNTCLLYTSPSPRDRQKSRMPSSA